MKITVIGSGIGGLGSAILLARAGHKVSVFEKNERLGGRVDSFEEKGFRFDTGPTWYLMPDVIDRYFKLLGTSADQHLKLHKLNPTYRVYFSERKEPVDFFSDPKRDLATADLIEQGGAKKLTAHLKDAKRLYDLAINTFLFRNYRSIFDLLSPRFLFSALPLLPFLTSFHSRVAARFRSSEMQKVLGYTTVFLGSSPYKTPAVYSFMSYVDLGLGAFYPEGGMRKLIEVLQKIGEEAGVEYHVNSPVVKINTVNGKATALELKNGEVIPTDVVISNADIIHTESTLLKKESQSYSPKYWDSRVLAPSVFLLFLGIDKKITQLRHHTLVFSKDWQKNFADIFDKPVWPGDPSLYICAASRTDEAAAPAGCEGLYVLVPIAAGLPDTPEERVRYRNEIVKILEERLDEPGLASHIIYEKIVGPTDFMAMYNAPKGTAFGFAQTLDQTAVWRPKNKSRKVRNLYYAGASTHPGIGLPTCLVSAELTAKRILEEQK